MTLIDYDSDSFDYSEPTSYPALTVRRRSPHVPGRSPGSCGDAAHAQRPSQVRHTLTRGASTRTLLLIIIISSSSE